MALFLDFKTGLRKNFRITFISPGRKYSVYGPVFHLQAWPPVIKRTAF